jgi:hypothetical protein
MKCFQCLKDEKNKKIKWSQVEEAVTIINGQAYCYKHLCNEIGWLNIFKLDEDNK